MIHYPYMHLPVSMDKDVWTQLIQGEMKNGGLQTPASHADAGVVHTQVQPLGTGIQKKATN